MKVFLIVPLVSALFLLAKALPAPPRPEKTKDLEKPPPGHQKRTEPGSEVPHHVVTHPRLHKDIADAEKPLPTEHIRSKRSEEAHPALPRLHKDEGDQKPPPTAHKDKRAFGEEGSLDQEDHEAPASPRGVHGKLPKDSGEEKPPPGQHKIR